MHLCFATPSPVLSLSSRFPTSTRLCVRPSPSTRRWRSRPILAAASPPDGDETDPPANDEHDIPQSAVDWNSEWSNFTEAGMRSMAPKGREPISKQQLAAARAKGKVQKITDTLPSRQQLFRDWRFWVAIIATLSLFSAFIQSSQTVGGSPI